MIWAITGGSGQLGTALQEILITNQIEHKSFNKEDIDITKIGDLKKLKELRPSLIINCAAWTNVDSAEFNYKSALEINCNGVRNLANIAQSLDIPLIHISTDYVFSGEGDSPWQTSQETNPKNVYGKSKLEGEKAALEIYPSNTYVLRTSWLFSPWGANFARTMTERAIKGMSSNVVSDQIGRPTSALDLAEQIHKLVSYKASPGIYHFANSGTASWYEFAKEIHSLVGVKDNLLTPVSSDEYATAAVRPKNSVLEISGLSDQNLPEMENWKSALKRIFPRILSSVEKGL